MGYSDPISVLEQILGENQSIDFALAPPIETPRSTMGRALAYIVSGLLKVTDNVINTRV